MLADERLDLSTQLSVASHRDPGLHAFFDCRKPKFVQSSRFGLEVELVGEVAERGAPPKCQRIREPGFGRLGVTFDECSRPSAIKRAARQASSSSASTRSK